MSRGDDDAQRATSPEAKAGPNPETKTCHLVVRPCRHGATGIAAEIEAKNALCGQKICGPLRHDLARLSITPIGEKLGVVGRVEVELDPRDAPPGGEADKTGCGVDSARGANGDEKIRIHHALLHLVKVTGDLAEPDDIGTHREGLAGGTRRFGGKVSGPFRHVPAGVTLRLLKQTMDGENVLTARSLVEVIHILRHQGEGPAAFHERVFKFRQSRMGGIGLNARQLCTAGIVEGVNSRRIFRKALRRRHLHGIILLPHTTLITERIHT